MWPYQARERWHEPGGAPKRGRQALPFAEILAANFLMPPIIIKETMPHLKATQALEKDCDFILLSPAGLVSKC